MASIASRKPFKPSVNTGNQDILDPSVGEICQYLQPEIGTFVLGNVEPQHIFSSLKVNPKNGVYCFTHYLAILMDIVVNGIKPDNRVNRLQETDLPSFYRHQ